MKKSLVVLLILTLCMGIFAACGNENEANKVSGEAGADKKVILVVSFGTSYNETRALTIDAIENEIAKAYPDYEIRRAFTSQIIIDKLADRDNLKIDNVTQAMDKLVADGVKTLVVQPTHVMDGFEYEEMVEAIKPYEDKFTKIAYGLPLLMSDEDFKEVMNILVEETKAYDQEGSALLFMGHGTEHPANASYQKLADLLHENGHNNYLIGTVEGEPILEEIIPQLEALNAKKVFLLPFMIVAGDHANNDLAGDEEDSWKTQLKAKGYEVEPVLKGLGEYDGIQQMFVEHTGDAIAELGE